MAVLTSKAIVLSALKYSESSLIVKCYTEKLGVKTYLIRGVLKNKKGNTVSNMSSTRALRDVTEKHGGTYYASAVGEVNVVNKMKAVDAVIGGEGNGGIIVPELHYGRDALIGIALFLSHLAKFGKSIKELRNTYPNYIISKNKIHRDNLRKTICINTRNSTNMLIV